MGLLGQIDMELQKDLIDFVKAQKEKPYPHTLGESLLATILEDIIKGDARISGSVTDHKTSGCIWKSAFMRMRWSRNEQKQIYENHSRNE